MRTYLKMITATALSVSVAHGALAGNSGTADAADGPIRLAAQATDESNADLNRRVDDLERKMDKILDLLQRQNDDATGGSAQPQSGTDDPAPVEAQTALQSGLRLNLFLVASRVKQRAFDFARGDLGVVPLMDGAPVATGKVKVPDYFGWDAFTQVPAMDRFHGLISQLGADKQVALQWEGMLEAQEAGDYQYVVSINVGKKSGSSACVGLLQIDDQEVVRLESRKDGISYGDSKARNAIDQGALNLAAGPHKFSFWGYCTGEARGIVDHSAVRFEVQQKAPSDDNPEPLGAQSLFVDD